MSSFYAKQYYEMEYETVMVNEVHYLHLFIYLFFAKGP